MGIDFDDVINTLLILSSLPKSWELIVILMSSSSRGKKLRFDDVRDLVLGEEMRRKNKSVSTDAVLVMKNEQQWER